MNPNKSRRVESLNLAANRLQRRIIDACRECRRQRISDIACGALHYCSSCRMLRLFRDFEIAYSRLRTARLHRLDVEWIPLDQWMQAGDACRTKLTERDNSGMRNRPPPALSPNAPQPVGRNLQLPTAAQPSANTAQAARTRSPAPPLPAGVNAPQPTGAAVQTNVAKHRTSAH